MVNKQSPFSTFDTRRRQQPLNVIYYCDHSVFANKLSSKSDRQRGRVASTLK